MNVKPPNINAINPGSGVTNPEAVKVPLPDTVVTAVVRGLLDEMRSINEELKGRLRPVLTQRVWHPG